ncbi:MAG TPA: VOC family protein [Acidimicrobiales bacterium]|nr:VOC family protein [Acidimicrobiales bacterium]
MTTRLVSLCFDANDPVRLARFWASTVGWEIYDESSAEIGVLPTDGTRFILVFLPVPEPKTAKNPIHLDLVGESVDDQREIVDRLIGLGAEHVDIGQGSDADHVVLADPEGNEFCVVLRGDFLADTGFIGAVVFEPANPATGHFWGKAIGWPVVYDQDGDVAIRAPDGQGPFITFGPPGVAKSGKNRLHLDVAPNADDDQVTEVDRLIALGARRIDIGQGDVPWVVCADPDGNEFCVLSPQ